MKSDLKNILAKNPIIASLCRESDLGDLRLSNVRIAFILYGDLQSLPSIASRIKKANILPFIHIDFIVSRRPSDLRKTIRAPNS